MIFSASPYLGEVSIDLTPIRYDCSRKSFLSIGTVLGENPYLSIPNLAVPRLILLFWSFKVTLY